MSSDRQLNYVNNLQNRDQNLYYVDDASELNNINLEENDKIYAINDNKLFQMEIVDQEEELSGSIISFNGRNNTKIKSLVVNIVPVQSGTGDPSPDNDRPISGWTGANIFGSDGNMICAPQDDWYQTFIPAGSIVSASVESDIQSRIDYYRKDKTPIDYYTLNSAYGNRYGRTFTINEDVYYVKFNRGTNAVVRRGSNLYDYCQYANVLPINWQSEAGTVYGGTVTLNEDGSVDVVSKLGIYTIDGSKLAVAGDIDLNKYVRTSTVPSSTYNNNINATCSDQYPIVDTSVSDTSKIGLRFNPNKYIYIYNSAFTNLTTAQSLLNANPVNVVLTLTTPVTYHFPNVGQLRSFLGMNNIWSDIGDITVKIAEKGITAFELEPHI